MLARKPRIGQTVCCAGGGVSGGDGGGRGAGGGDCGGGCGCGVGCGDGGGVGSVAENIVVGGWEACLRRSCGKAKRCAGSRSSFYFGAKMLAPTMAVDKFESFRRQSMPASRLLYSIVEFVHLKRAFNVL